jgi:ribosomal protein S18 acetylase RimI-like enzyme
MNGEQLTLIAGLADILAHRRQMDHAVDTVIFDRSYSQQWMALYSESYAEQFDYSQEEVEADWQATLRSEYGTVWEQASPMVLVAGKVVGSLVTVREAPWADTPPGPFVIEAMVAPAHRCRGIATCLFVASAEVCKAAGYSTLALRVLNSNAAAKRLYSNLGFSDWSGPPRDITAK